MTGLIHHSHAAASQFAKNLVVAETAPEAEHNFLRG
jgi:hypothetical protein